MRYLPVLLSCLLLAAHHLRAGEHGLIGLWLSLPLALLLRRRWADRALQIVLLGGAVEWLLALQGILTMYAELGKPGLRATLIIGGVASVTALSTLVLETHRRRQRFPDGDPVGSGLGAFLLTGALLMTVQLMVDRPVILLERFLAGGGWWQGAVLAFYAGWLADRLRDPRAVKQLRPVVWLAFSGIFFTQLLLGLAGMEKLLMTGALHLPVPALIVAGPIYRGGGLFMAILFATSVLVLGPAWCSWLCYVGAWDDRLARLRSRPGTLPGWRRHFRVGVLVAVLGTALLLGQLGVNATAAVWLAASFGLVGVLFMVLWSRRSGHMTHCTAWCPMGWLATRLGKLSPWRLRISDTCIDCGSCTPACRYDALYPADVSRRQPGEACTLCGDCQSVCPTDSIRYHWLSADTHRARQVFFLVVAAWHAVFIGVARL